MKRDGSGVSRISIFFEGLCAGLGLRFCVKALRARDLVCGGAASVSVANNVSK